MVSNVYGQIYALPTVPLPIERSSWGYPYIISSILNLFKKKNVPQFEPCTLIPIQTNCCVDPLPSQCVNVDLNIFTITDVFANYELSWLYKFDGIIEEYMMQGYLDINNLIILTSCLQEATYCTSSLIFGYEMSYNYKVMKTDLLLHIVDFHNNFISDKTIKYYSEIVEALDIYLNTNYIYRTT